MDPTWNNATRNPAIRHHDCIRSNLYYYIGTPILTRFKMFIMAATIGKGKKKTGKRKEKRDRNKNIIKYTPIK